MFELLQIRNSAGSCVGEVRCGDDVTILLRISATEPILRARIAIRFFNSKGERVLTCHSDYQFPQRLVIKGYTLCSCEIFGLRLVPGDYSIELQLDDWQTIYDKISDGISIRVLPKDLYGTGRLIPSNATIWLPEVRWELIAP
jgi:hypothetical protein